MDLLGYIIDYMNNKVSVASNLFSKQYGLSEFRKKEGDYYTYLSKGQGKPVTNYDKERGTMLWVKRSQVTFGDAPQLLKDTGCADYYTITYPLRAVCVVKKKELPCDNATSVDQVAQELLTKLSGKDKVLRSAVGASLVDIIPRGYTVLDNITKNMEYACVGIDYDIQVSIKKSCIPDLCEDVPLPSCEFSVTLQNSDGKTIYTITQDTANPFPLGNQPIVDGQGNTINVPYDPDTPYVTTPCTIVCDDATAVLKDTDGNTLSSTDIPSGGTQDIVAPDGDVTVNSAAFDSVLSGGTLDVPVQYENGTPVGSIVGGVVEIPNPITCADATAVLKNTDGTTISSTDIPSGSSQDITAPDATAVLKDTDGNILLTEPIPSNVSEDIVAPDGTVTVNSSAFDTVLSGGSLNIQVRQQSGSTQVGSKQGQYWRVDDSDISINGTPFDSVAAEDSIDLDVQYANGTPVGSDVGGVWTIPDPVQDLVTKVNFETGATLDFDITIDSDTAGTYTANTFGGSTTSATYEVNSVAATLPFTVVATDVLTIFPDADNGFVRLTGTY